MRKKFIIIVFVLLLSLAPAYCLFMTENEIKFFEVDVLSPLCLSKVQSTYQVCAPLIFSIDGDFISVPKGYITRLETIPSWYQGIADPSRKDSIEASIIHDYLYNCPGGSTRIDIDSILYQIMLNRGASEEVATKMYFAVRLFGADKFNYDKECYPNEDGDDEQYDMDDRGRWISKS